MNRVYLWLSLLTVSLLCISHAHAKPPIQDTLPQPAHECPRSAAISPERVHLDASGVFSASYSHGGGCGKHDYCIGYNDTDPAHVEVWMSHLHDGTDRCEAELFKELKVQLPASVLHAKNISLVTFAETKPLTIAAANAAACPESVAVTPSAFKLGEDGTFEATYEHGGGCDQHAYCIGHAYDAATDTARVWMGHLHEGADMCDALLVGSAKLALPAEILKAKKLQLFSPDIPPKSLRD